jgi:butyryl-CoA dehydrogenase
LEEATRWVIDAFTRDAREAAAGAVPYLELAGIVLGAGLMARAAVIAQARLDDGSGDAEFYQAKIKTARFFCDHILPRSAALTHTIVSGARSTLALSEAQF